MAGKSKTFKDKLDGRIVCLKWTICSFNVFAFMIGASIFALCIWMKVEPGISDWVKRLDLGKIYSGVFVLIVSSIMVMIVSFAGCFAALMESKGILLIFVGTQVLSFILGLAGSAVLLAYTTTSSKLQPLIRDAMRRLIMDSGSETSAATLRTIQENVGCCGADGPNDYLWLRQPLPSECRDSVTGNAFFYGCVDELTWFFEDKCGWVCGLAMSLCAIHVLNIVLCTILTKAIRKEERLDEPSYEIKPMARDQM